jgi:hypothetical protein
VKPSVKYWLLTVTVDQVLRLVILKVKKRNNTRNRPQQKTNHKLQQVSEKYQSWDTLEEGTLVFILLSPQPKMKES